MAFTLLRSITVDFSTDADPQPIKAVQGDQTRVAKITLLNKGVPINLTGLTVRAYVMPFGETVGLYEDVAVTDATAGKVEYSLSGNACIKAGDGVVNIQVTETATGKQAYTDEIPLKVKARKDFTGAIVGSTVFSALQTAIATALGLDAAAVHKAGAETIAGLKSVPTPTAAAHIANKDYVDQNINLVKARFYSNVSTHTNVAAGVASEAAIAYPTGFTQANSVIIGLALLPSSSGLVQTTVFGNSATNDFQIFVLNGGGSTQTFYVRYTLMRTD